MSKRNNNSQYLLLILFIGFAINLIILYIKGERGSMWDVEVYINGADYLIQNGSFEDIHHVFYGLHVTIIALGRLLLPTQIIQVIIFQILLSLLAATALYYSALKLFASKNAALLSCLIFVFWWDCIHWNTVLMSESLFCSLTILVLYILTHFEGRRNDFIKLAIVLLTLCFTRPTAIVILVGVVAFLLFYYKEALMNLSRLKRTALITSFFFLSLLGATLMFQKWDFTQDYINGEVVTYMSTIQDSPLYSSDLHTPLEKVVDKQSNRQLGILRIMDFIVSHPAYFLSMSIKKVYYLLSFQRPYYSSAHNLYSAIWLFFIYSFFVLGLMKSASAPIKAFVLAVIVVNCMLIGMSTVDWDNRFFIPMEPGIVLFAGYGAYKILVKLKCHLNTKGYFNLLT